MGYISTGQRDRVTPKDLPPIEEAIGRGGGVYECSNGQRFRAKPAQWVAVKPHKAKGKRLRVAG